MNKAKSRLSNAKYLRYRVITRYNRNIFILVAVSITLFLTGLILGRYLAAEQELLSPIVHPPKYFKASTTNSPVEEPKTNEAESNSALEGDILYSGKVSYYSHAGCLGCHPQQLMGNGKPFNEMAMTLAVPCEDVIKPARVKYNTKVLVTNIDTNKSVQATITDCGGFSKYNRVADLSLGLAQELGAKTDQSTIVITLLGGAK